MVSYSAPEKMPFSARSLLGAPSAQVEGYFPAQQEGGYLEGMEFFVKFAR